MKLLRFRTLEVNQEPNGYTTIRTIVTYLKQKAQSKPLQSCLYVCIPHFLPAILITTITTITGTTATFSRQANIAVLPFYLVESSEAPSVEAVWCRIATVVVIPQPFSRVSLWSVRVSLGFLNAPLLARDTAPGHVRMASVILSVVLDVAFSWVCDNQ